jgi:hypothetical protein
VRGCSKVRRKGLRIDKKFYGYRTYRIGFTSITV